MNERCNVNVPDDLESTPLVNEFVKEIGPLHAYVEGMITTPEGELIDGNDFMAEVDACMEQLTTPLLLPTAEQREIIDRELRPYRPYMEPYLNLTLRGEEHIPSPEGSCGYDNGRNGGLPFPYASPCYCSVSPIVWETPGAQLAEGKHVACEAIVDRETDGTFTVKSAQCENDRFEESFVRSLERHPVNRSYDQLGNLCTPTTRNISRSNRDIVIQHTYHGPEAD